MSIGSRCSICMCHRLCLTADADACPILLFPLGFVSADCQCSVATMTGIRRHNTSPACQSVLCLWVADSACVCRDFCSCRFDSVQTIFCLSLPLFTGGQITATHFYASLFFKNALVIYALRFREFFQTIALVIVTFNII